MNLRLLTVILAGLTAVPSAWACRYSVRDVSFVDLEPVPYYLYYFIDSAAHRPAAEQVQRIASGVFLDSNVTLEVVDLRTDPDHAARVHLSNGERTAPAGVLVSPDQRALPLALPTQSSEGGSSKDAVWNFVETAIQSPAREQLFESIVDAYAVVLLIEGTDSAQNRRAKRAIESAITAIESVMPRMPKPVDVPPKLLVLDQAAAARENVFLWSLDLRTQSGPEPQAAIMLGRGRRIGPTLTGGMITQTQVQEILGLIGQDCECELDRAWMQGPMIPARWDTDLQQRAFASLGFDAENPLVKSEMTRILARGPNSRGTAAPAAASFDSLFLGYSEEVISDDPAPESPEIPAAAQAIESVPATGSSEDTGSAAAEAAPIQDDDEDGDNDASTTFRPALIALIVIGGGTLLGAGIVALMAMKQG